MIETSFNNWQTQDKIVYNPSALTFKYLYYFITQIRTIVLYLPNAIITRCTVPVDIDRAKEALLNKYIDEWKTQVENVPKLRT